MRCRPCLWPTFYWFHLSRCSFIFYRESSHLYFLCGEIVLLMLNLYLLKLIWLSSRCYYYYIRKLRITFYSFKFYIRWFVHTALWISLVYDIISHLTYFCHSRCFIHVVCTVQCQCTGGASSHTVQPDPGQRRARPGGGVRPHIRPPAAHHFICHGPDPKRVAGGTISLARSAGCPCIIWVHIVVSCCHLVTGCI